MGTDTTVQEARSAVAPRALRRVPTPHTIRQIIDAGNPIPDPGGMPGALRYDVPGAFRGVG